VRRARLAAIALGLAMLSSVTLASAFCRTRGCDNTNPKQQCEFDGNGCLLSGPLLHWGSSCVSFDVQKDGSALRGISYADAHGAIQNAFQQWLNADCGGGGPDIELSDYGPVECRKAEYNQDAGNANTFMFRDEVWPYPNAIDTLALTTLIFNADDGEIYDADVEVNTFESNMVVSNVGRDDVDFNSVITHEIGHFLGLSHSNVLGSTMRPSYAPGATSMASIEQDDVDGVCDALPPGRATNSNSCDPRHGFSDKCAVSRSSCQLSPGQAGDWGSALVALLGLSSTLTRRRSRRASPRRAADPDRRQGPDSAS
jgi:hypothetical protein